MHDLIKLHAEHAHLVDIVGRLSALIKQREPPVAGDLFKLRHELTSTLIAHLKAEDWVLYPRLISSRNAHVAATARSFSDEMGGLADTYRGYTNKWTALSIVYDWPGYCHDTALVLEALVSRINRENRELYPLLEAMDNAA